MIDQEEESLLVQGRGLDQVEAVVVLLVGRNTRTSTVELPGGDQAQVAVALLVLDEGHQATGALSSNPVASIPGVRVGELGGDERTEEHVAVQRLSRLQEVHESRHLVHVREGHRRQPQGHRTLHQGRGGVDPGEQGVVAMDAERDVHQVEIRVNGEH